jgi:hypothetical protein
LDGGFSSPKNRHIFEIFLWKFRVVELSLEADWTLWAETGVVNVGGKTQTS